MQSFTHFRCKFRNNGVQFTANFSSGLSLGCARPVYLQIYKRDFNGVPIAVVPERYDASQHGYYDIYGRGPRFRGLFEYSFNPGIYFRAGLESDYSVVPEIIQSIEVGIAVDAYLNEIEIMANNSPSYYFATLYLNFLLFTPTDHVGIEVIPPALDEEGPEIDPRLMLLRFLHKILLEIREKTSAMSSYPFSKTAKIRYEYGLFQSTIKALDKRLLRQKMLKSLRHSQNFGHSK